MIEVEALKKYFSSGILGKQHIKAVNGVSFQIKRGETLWLVGESGCGKPWEIALTIDRTNRGSFLMTLIC